MSETNKYNNSKIYKIWSPSREDLVYYGSTYQSLSRRMSIHRSNYRRWKEGKIYMVTAFKIFDECDDYRIELVENYPCSNKEQLNAREGYYIRNYACTNKFIAGRTRSEYYKDNKEELKQYYDTNKEKILERQREYIRANREKINEQAKEYREANREKIKERNKKQYQARKEQVKQNVENPQ